MADNKPPEKSAPNSKPLDIEELRKMVREDIEEQRKIAEQLRRKMN